MYVYNVTVVGASVPLGVYGTPEKAVSIAEMIANRGVKDSESFALVYEAGYDEQDGIQYNEASPAMIEKELEDGKFSVIIQSSSGGGKKVKIDKWEVQ